MGKSRHHEHPGHQHNKEISPAQRQRQRDQEVEQEGYFELIAEAIADLGDAGRIFRLPRRDVLQAGFPGFHRLCAGRHHPQQQEESESDRHEDRQ